MIDKKFYIIFRYSLLLIIVVTQLLTLSELSVVHLVMLLGLFITSNLKFYYSKPDKLGRIDLHFIDLLIYLALFKISAFISPFFFLLLLFDAFYFNKNVQSYIILFFTFVVYSYTLRFQASDMIIKNLLLFMLCSIFVISLNRLRIALVKSQEEIDELTNKNEDLALSQQHLELYNDSIEDLIVLKERNRISREIHDSVGHGLSTIIIQLNALSRMAESQPKLLAEQIGNLNDFAKKNLEEVRFALRELKPKNYNKYESIILIHSLIGEFKNLTGIFVQLSFSKNIKPLTDDQNHALYKAVQEFLSNSGKYGHPSKITIHFAYSDFSLIVNLQDNGVGCSDIKKGIGLTAIEERMKECGASVNYESLPKVKGFFMQLVFPF